MLKRYGLIGFLQLCISFVYTKFFFSKARLIRLPFDIRNREFIKLGTNLTTGKGCRIEAYPVNGASKVIIAFGNDIEINDYVHIAGGSNVTIGDNVLIASRVFISDINHGKYKGNNQDSPLSKPGDRILTTKDVIIKENVWIGEGVCVLAGVTIGKGSIIGALSVITKDIPDYSIAVGSPAKVVKQYDFEKKEWISINTD